MTTPTAKTSTATTCRPDVYRRVTDRIVADLDQGARPWAKPWHADHTGGHLLLPRRHNGPAYRGINILLLWGETMAKGFSQPVWMTYRQAAALKAQVRKGEHGSLVVYADRFTKTEQDAHGQEVETEIPFLKAYAVFNVEQIDGLPESYVTKPSGPANPVSVIDAAEDFFAATGATIRHCRVALNSFIVRFLAANSWTVPTRFYELAAIASNS